jgi:hypothetical protein
MATTTTYRSTVPAARDGFAQVLRAEWTKFRSVRSTVWCLILAVALTILLSLLGAAGSSTDANCAPPYDDQFSFMHQPLAGAGSVTARVATQRNSHEWAKAGIMIKQSARSGAPYAALVITPRHGAYLQANFAAGTAVGANPPPRWLRLDRSGPTITGYTSADGTTWNRVGAVDLGGLPPTVEVGLFVASPANQRVEHPNAATTIVRGIPTVGTATFDNVRLDAATAQPAGRWRHHDVFPPGSDPRTTGRRPGTATEAGGTYTVTGSGDIRAVSLRGDNDIARNSFLGVVIGVMAIVALGVLFATSEFKTGIIRTTFAASPRRGRVLAAKVVVLGGIALLAGLIASVGAFTLVQPVLRDNGFSPPAYPHASLTDGPMLRAVVGTALFLTVIGLFSLGVGAILRRSATAITLVIALVVVPQVIVPVLAVDAARWVYRLTPPAGLAMQQTVAGRFDNWISPWAGLGVTCAYAAAVLCVAFWLLRRRDA